MCICSYWSCEIVNMVMFGNVTLLPNFVTLYYIWTYIRILHVPDVNYYACIQYGRIEDIDIKFPREPRGTSYAFIQFRDSRDADDACHARDGYKFDSDHRLRVEMR
jgi:hypothetical protein